MNRRPSTASASPVGRVTLTLHGPIGELAAALRTLADALDQKQTTSTVTYAATLDPQARGPAPGGMTASLADRFVAQLTPAAVEVLAVVCRHSPEVTYEALQAHVQAHLGISRDRLGGVLTSLAGAASGCRGTSTTRSNGTRTYATTGSSQLPPNSSWVRLSTLARLDWLPGEARPMLSLPARGP
jgi:hypothetical protein